MLRADKVDSPTLIIHGTADEVVPYEHGRELFEKAGRPWKFASLENAGHNNIECDFMDDLLSTLRSFLDFLDSAQEPQSDVNDSPIKEDWHPQND